METDVPRGGHRGTAPEYADGVDVRTITSPKQMSVEGLCQICETAPIEHQCSRCGALVCPTHYDTETGLCTDCAAALDSTRAE